MNKKEALPDLGGAFLVHPAQKNRGCGDALLGGAATQKSTRLRSAFWLFV
jgi:hypothetical protein